MASRVRVALGECTVVDERPDRFASNEAMVALHMARKRVRLVAEGAMINTTYKRFPIDALAAFKADLLLVLGDE